MILALILFALPCCVLVRIVLSFLSLTPALAAILSCRYLRKTLAKIEPHRMQVNAYLILTVPIKTEEQDLVLWNFQCQVQQKRLRALF